MEINKLKKDKVCVYIESEGHKERARDMLEENGEKVDEHNFTKTLDNFTSERYLMFDKDFNEWYLGYGTHVEITLSELETFLEKENE